MSVTEVQVQQVVERINQIDRRDSGPVMVALDGPGGAGKSTLASALAATTGAAIVEGDDFYAGGTAEDWDAMTAIEKAAHCIDWRRQVPVLQALRRGEPASWYPFDWITNDGRLLTTLVTCAPERVVVLDGVYSARPELAHLFDLRVFLDAPRTLRRQRQVERDGANSWTEWHERWAAAEDHYFQNVMPPPAFDVILQG